MSQITTKQTFDLQPTNFEQAMKYAELIAKSSLVPKDYKDKPGDVLVAIQMGHELGLKPLQSLQNIATINGRPCIWGDAMLAIVQSHPEFEYIKEYMENDNKAACIIKRKNMPEQTRTFSMDDAKKAGLKDKSGPWLQYPSRMLQMRARGFALRDTFADALKGIVSREEAEDFSQENRQHSDSKVTAIKNLINQPAQETMIQHEVSRTAQPKQSEKDSFLEDIRTAETPEELKAVLISGRDYAKSIGDKALYAQLFKAATEHSARLQKTKAPGDLDKGWDEFQKDDSLME